MPHQIPTNQSFSQTGTYPPGTVHLFHPQHPDHWGLDNGCYRIPRYGIRSD